MRYNELPSQFFVRNRKKLTACLTEKSVVFVTSNDEMPDSWDETFPFHQNPDFFYLTGIDQEKSLLVLCPEHPNPAYREMLFLQQTNPTIAVWNGYKYTKEHARRVSGIENIHWLDEFDTLRKEVAYFADTIYLDIEEESRFHSEVEKQAERFCKSMKQLFPLHSYRRLAPIMKELRLRKEEVEIDQIQKAIDITQSAFERMLRMVQPGVKEYEVEAEMSCEFIRNGASGHAFSPIVASGPDSCVLHYIKNDKICQNGELLLLDFGCRYANYNSDISRTLPVNGKFTPRQRQVYEACHRVFKAAQTQYFPGNSIHKVNDFVWKLMEKELIGLGLFTAEDVAKAGDSMPLIRKYYMHNIGHFLGLDTHDVGSREVVFENGMVITCEPGIYIAEEGIGVRIETDMLVADTPIDLGAAIPSEADEIEKLMQR